MSRIPSQHTKSSLYFYEYFVVFILVIYAGKASAFVQAFDNWDNIAGFGLPITSVAVLGLIKDAKLSSKYWLFILGFTLYFAASTLTVGELHPRFFGIQIINFTLVFIVLSSLRFRFFLIYENILYYLCIIALFIWTFQNLFPVATVELLHNFEFSSQKAVEGNNVAFNTLFYTVSNFEYMGEPYFHLGSIQFIRNAGFAWEPGAFSTYVSIAIFFNLLRNKFKLLQIKHLIIYGVTLISTFSTTGYSLLILLCLFYVYNQNLIRITWMVPLSTIVIIFLFTLPFMKDKITRKSTVSAEELVYYSAKYNYKYSTQRFQSLQIDFVDFVNHPILGYGGHQEASWTNQLGARVVSISGFGQIMAQYGSVGILFFLISIWQSSKQITILFNAKGAIFPALLLFMISLSYGVFVLIYMCIWVFYLTNIYKSELYRRYTIKRVVNELAL